MGQSFGRDNKFNRDRWLETALQSVPPNTKILDAGAGELQYKKFCEHLHYTAQDFGQYDGEGNHSGLQTGTWDNSKLDIVSDILSIPVEDASFGAVLCVEVMEHLPTPHLALMEFARILEPGGKLILTAPVCSLTHFAPVYYYNGFSRHFFEKHLEEFGFNIVELSFNGSYFHYLAQEIQRIPKIAKQFSKINSLQKVWLRVTAKTQIALLHKFARIDTGSQELLSYGIHLIAEKKSDGESSKQ